MSAGLGKAVNISSVILRRAKPNVGIRIPTLQSDKENGLHPKGTSSGFALRAPRQCAHWLAMTGGIFREGTSLGCKAVAEGLPPLPIWI